MKIGGVELTFSIFDADDLQRFEECNDRLILREEEQPKELMGPDAIRYQCKAFIEFFDALFGEGTSAAIFHGRTNIVKCRDAYYALMDAMEAEGEEQARILRERKERYGAASWRSPA